MPYGVCELRMMGRTGDRAHASHLDDAGAVRAWISLRYPRTHARKASLTSYVGRKILKACQGKSRTAVDTRGGAKVCR